MIDPTNTYVRLSALIAFVQAADPSLWAAFEGFEALDRIANRRASQDYATQGAPDDAPDLGIE